MYEHVFLYGSYVSLFICGICDVIGCAYYVLCFLLPQSPFLEDGGIIGWMEETMYAYTYNSVFLVCMDGWHVYQFHILYAYVLHMYLFLSSFYICMC